MDRKFTAPNDLVWEILLRVARVSVPELVGRRAELAALSALAATRHTRMVLVDGDAGVGKTRLVKASASALGLTARETEIFTLVGQGKTNAEIAEELFISAKTASVHVSNILRKLGVTSRIQAAALAHRQEHR